MLLLLAEPVWAPTSPVSSWAVRSARRPWSTRRRGGSPAGNSILGGNVLPIERNEKKTTIAVASCSWARPRIPCVQRQLPRSAANQFGRLTVPGNRSHVPKQARPAGVRRSYGEGVRPVPATRTRQMGKPIEPAHSPPPSPTCHRLDIQHAGATFSPSVPHKIQVSQASSSEEPAPDGSARAAAGGSRTRRFPAARFAVSYRILGRPALAAPEQWIPESEGICA